MTASNNLAIVAACAGDPARASMLNVLADGRAFTAGELAAVAHVTAQTASGHLARMVDAGLLAVASQGRHRYYRIASPQVALMLESMMVVAAAPRVGRVGPADESLRLARTCYDHLAGRLAVAIAGSLVEAGHLSLSEDGGELSAGGRAFFDKLGIDLASDNGRRPFCRPCLDWSERRHHLAGTLGTRIMAHSLQSGWVQRSPKSRAVAITPLGLRKFREVYGVRLDV